MARIKNRRVRLFIQANSFYFTSNKSSILELTEWISNNLGADDPFAGAKRVDMNARMNYNSGYTDIMLYKKAGV